MKKKPKISVIVPVYNAEEYLEQCLDSIVNQTLDDIEIICVNDGSKDSSLAILKEYSCKYSNIKVINQKNYGIIGARISGFKNATGEYIGWVDNDDFIELNMYEKLYNTTKKGEADIVICNYDFYPHSISTKEKWFREYKGKMDWHFISHNGLLWNKIVKRQLLEKIDFVHLLRKLGEGSYTIALLKAKKIVTINAELYHYRVGHNSTSGSFIGKTEYYLETSKREEQKLEMIKQMNLNKDLILYFEYYAMRSKLVLALVAALNNNRKLYSSSIKFLKDSHFFQKKYSIFFHEDFSKIKRIFLKHILMNSYFLTRTIAKRVCKGSSK